MCAICKDGNDPGVGVRGLGVRGQGGPGAVPLGAHGLSASGQNSWQVLSLPSEFARSLEWDNMRESFERHDKLLEDKGKVCAYAF